MDFFTFVIQADVHRSDWNSLLWNSLPTHLESTHHLTMNHLARITIWPLLRWCVHSTSFIHRETYKIVVAPFHFTKIFLYERIAISDKSTNKENRIEEDILNAFMHIILMRIILRPLFQTKEDLLKAFLCAWSWDLCFKLAACDWPFLVLCFLMLLKKWNILSYHSPFLP